MLLAFEEIKKKGTLLWCNARIIAIEFYKKIGFQIKGEEFDIADIGKHYFMYKNKLNLLHVRSTILFTLQK